MRDRREPSFLGDNLSILMRIIRRCGLRKVLETIKDASHVRFIAIRSFFSELFIARSLQRD